MKIETGYKPGLIGAVVEMHARYYSRNYAFGAYFEATVAAGLADLVPRLENTRNQIWHVAEGGKISASVAIDGEDLGNNTAHLRWFIVDETLRGTGMGNRLLQAAVQFCDEQEFDRCVLWTFRGLDAARKLYEKFDFKLVEEVEGEQWGKTVYEQRFERTK